MFNKKSDTLIIIPAYNEEGSIEAVVRNLEMNFQEFDYVVVNDGSKDATSEICHRNGFNIIDLPVNLGLTGAVQTGFKYAYKMDYEQAVQFDGDGQHLPEYVGDLVAEIQKGQDCVIGSRFVSEPKNNSLRMLGNRLISWSIKLTTGQTITDPTSGMRMFNKDLIKDFALNVNYTPEPDTISFLIRQGYKIKEVQVKMLERQAGQSYLTLSRSIKYMIHMFISILLIQNFRRK
ncbi:TPA: glycosyltransferase family 2 protein [Streptococcus suis]